MNSFVFCTVLLSSALVIDAGLVRVRRDKPLSSYGAGAVGQASAFSPVTTSFGGSASFSSAAGSFGGAAASAPAAPVVEIISEVNNAPGTLGDNSDFDNSFEAANGIRQESSGSTVVIGDETVVVMKGSYEYVGEDGQTYVVDWIADENGFQPSAPHLPKDVPIPFPEIAAAVEAQIAFAAQEDAAAAAGGFQGQSNAGFGGQSQGFSGGFQAQTNSGFGGSQSFAASNPVPVNANLPSYSF